MHIWDILNIEPTDDLVVIKRAYGTLVKVHSPEDDPEAYQRLREAYDHAVKMVKRQTLLALTQGDADSEHLLTVTENKSAHLQPPISNRSHVSNQEQQFIEFMGHVSAVYADFSLRIEAAPWLRLLTSDIMWNLNLRHAVQDQMLTFLEKHPYLPREIWELINDYFHWREQAKENSDRFSIQFPNVYAYVFADPYYITSLQFSYLKEAGNIDYETYLHYRAKAFKALEYDDSQTAQEMLSNASSMFAQDPDLLRLQREYFLRQNRFSEALIVIDTMIQIVPEDTDLYFHRARIFLEQGKLEDANQQLTSLLLQNPNHLDALSLAGQCDMKRKDWKQAREIFTQLLSIQPNDIETIVFLTELDQMHRPQVVKPYIPMLSVANGIAFMNNAKQFMHRYNDQILYKIEHLDLYMIAFSAFCMKGKMAFSLAKNMLDVFDNKNRLYSALEYWDAADPDSFLIKLDSFMNMEMTKEFQSCRHRLSTLSQQERMKYIESLPDEDKRKGKFFVANYYLTRIPVAGMAAFEYSWGIYMCCAGCYLGYITVEECWGKVAQIVQNARASYSSWRDYVIGFAAGADFALQSTSFEYVKTYQDFLKKLLVAPESPLHQVSLGSI